MKNSVSKFRRFFPLCVLLLLVIVIFFVFFILLSGKRFDNSSGADGSNNDEVLDCSTGNIERSLFVGYGELEPNYNIKISFSDNRMRNISIIYTANFLTEQESKDAASAMHGRYNIYMRDSGVYHEALTPNFYAIGKKMTANLFITNDKLNSKTANLIFIDSGEYSSIDNYSIESLEALYNNKGFVCEIR